MVSQVQVNWTAAGGAGGVTLLHFPDDALDVDIVTDVTAWLTALRPTLATTTSAAVVDLVRQINTETGVLAFESPLGTIAPVVGTGGTSAGPNASQGLIRYRTSEVINGRVLKGRQYIPGMSSQAQASTGEVGPTGTNALNAAGVALRGAAGFGIWHRPVNGSGGAFATANQSSAWTEFAIQRRRRA